MRLHLYIVRGSLSKPRIQGLIDTMSATRSLTRVYWYSSCKSFSPYDWYEHILHNLLFTNLKQYTHNGQPYDTTSPLPWFFLIPPARSKQLTWNRENPSGSKFLRFSAMLKKSSLWIISQAKKTVWCRDSHFSDHRTCKAAALLSHLPFLQTTLAGYKLSGNSKPMRKLPIGAMQMASQGPKQSPLPQCDLGLPPTIPPAWDI